MYNNIFSKEFWNHAALTNPEGWILDGYTKKRFWEEEVKIDGLNQEMDFLDLGCGIGRVAKWIIPNIKAYYGVDFSDEMIRLAKKIYQSYPNIFFFVNNGIDLDIFSDEKFDFIYVHLVFQHMKKENTLNYINEIYRVLKYKGIFLAENIPKAEKYEGGLTQSEIDEAFKNFKILNKTSNEFYYFIRCQK